MKQRAQMMLIRRSLVVTGLLVLLSGDVLADGCRAAAPGGSVAQQDLAAVDRAFFSAYERAGGRSSATDHRRCSSSGTRSSSIAAATGAHCRCCRRCSTS